MQQPSRRRVSVRSREGTTPPPSALPLAYRLPNPPPVFVGRRRESAELAGRIKRAPVTVVCGIGGVGKTSLVLATLSRTFPTQIDRTVMVGLRPADAPGQLQLELVRALAGPLALATGWVTRAHDPDAYAEGVIDLAERAGRWVVLDDVHHDDAGFVAELLARVARFARRSRWIATSRVRPDEAGLAHQTLALGAMSERELDELARRAHPGVGRELRSRAVRGSSGSPWQLLCTLSGGDARPALPEVGEARALFEQLGLLEVAVGIDALAPLGANARWLDTLERAGLVERTARGVRLHDVARSLVDGTRAAGARGEVGRVLAATADPAAALEGVRLLLAVDEPAAASVINARAGEWLQEGYAARLWRLVSDSSDPRLRAVRLRCAGELGHADVVAGMARPPADDAPSTLWWARGQFAIGRCREAGEVAAALASHSSLELAFEAGVLLSRCHGVLGRPREAVAVLDGLAAPTRELELLRDAHRARWLLHTDAAAARELAGKVQGVLGSLPEGPRREAAERIGGVYVFLGHYRAAAQALPELGDDRADAFLSREILLWRLAVATMGGRFGEAAALIRRVRTMATATAQQRQYADLFDVARRIAVGELAGLDDALRSLLEQTASDGNAVVYQFASVYRDKLAVVCGDPTPARDWAAGMPAPIGLEADHLAMVRGQHALRWGRPWTPPAEGNALISVQVVHAIAQAEAALLAGEPELAMAATLRATNLAREHGQTLLEADAALARCEVAAAFGRSNLVDAATALHQLADALSSPRLQAEARFFGSIAGGLDPAVLEELAAHIDVAPAAARRSRRLLGCEARLDAVDTCVVAHVGEVAVEGGPTYQPGWGLDPTRKAVWLPGRWIDLTAAPLSQQIIAVVADAGGTISKDDLVCRAWGEPEYHPLRHDKRMQIAVHRLRRQIEDDPAAPRRLITTPDGYALGAGFRRVSRPNGS